MSRRAAVAALVLAVMAAAPAAVSAYLTLGTSVSGGTVQSRWSAMPVRYFITNRSVDNVTATQLQAAAGQAFATWSAVPTAAASGAFAGFTNAEPVRDDGATVIGFQPHSELERTLGVTTFTIDRTSGAIVEADIFLNTTFDWSTAAAGDPNRYDVQSVLTHEVGHLLGLGHSLLGETEIRPTGGRRVLGKASVMFPIAYTIGTTLDRALQDDDRTGMSVTYPTTAFLASTGSIMGRVTLDGAPVFGAHVVAFNTKTQRLIGGFSLGSNGQFTIDGLEPGVYVLRAEPIDDADISSFFEAAATVEVGFKTTFATALVTVPVGGAGASIEIKVARK